MFTYVDISSVDNRSKQITAAQTLAGKEAPSRARKRILEHDVLVSTTRPNLNAVALVPAHLNDQVCSTGFCVLRANASVLPEFLYLFVQSSAFVSPLAELVTGALYPAVTDYQVLDRLIPLPPLPIQRQIVESVTPALAMANSARRAAEDRVAVAEALSAASLREVFDGAEGKHWARVTINALRQEGVLVEHQDGNHGELHPRNRDFVASGVRFVTAKHIGRTGKLELLGAPFISHEQASGLRIGFAQARDVLLAHNATVGPVGIAPPDCEPFVVGTSLTIYRANGQHMDQEFLYLSLRSEEFQRQLLDAMKQTTRNQVPITRQRELKLPFPDISVQRRITRGLSARLEAADALVAKCRDELAAVDALPASLLRSVFNGDR